MAIEAPPGFVAARAGSRTLLCRPEHLDAARAAGLEEPSRWEELLAAGSRASGRGALGRLRLGPGPAWLLKRMRRGGGLAGVWRDRFAGSSRLLANLVVPALVAERGIPTARPAALLLLAGPRPLFQAWLAVEEIEGAQDLRTRLSLPPPPARAELEAVVGVVRRMHDSGVVHRDLNLGNLLLRQREAFVVDLDRALLRASPLGFRARQAALRRLERSYVKCFGEPGPLGAEGASMWYSLYAGEDRTLAERLRRGRGAGRARLALHRFGWRRGGTT